MYNKDKLSILDMQEAIEKIWQIVKNTISGFDKQIKEVLKRL